MQDQIEKLFLRIHNLIEMGALNEALKMLLLMKQKLPTFQHEIESEILKVKLMKGLYRETLDEALLCMQNGNEDIGNWLLKEFHEPFYQYHQNMKEMNCIKLDRYKYFYGLIEKSEIKILWFDESGKAVFVQDNHIVQIVDNVELENLDNIAILCNMLRIDKILEFERNTKYIGNLPNYSEPLYLYYDQIVFDVLLHCVDFSLLLDNERIVIIVGEDSLRHFFDDIQIEMPEFIVGYGRQKVTEILDLVYKGKYNRYYNDLQQVKQFYEESNYSILERMKCGKLKILFSISFFTTILKYHVRDCIRAANKMGLETELLIEKGNIFRTTEFERISVLNSFRPDLLFCIDHLRFERKNFGYFPDQIIWICWVQDPMPAIMNKNTPAKLGQRDFILNHFTTWKRFAEVGYSQNILIDAPIPASSDIYKRYDLSLEEYQMYTCDICFVCHGSDVNRHIKKVIDNISGNNSHKECEMIYEIYKGYENFVKQTGKFFYSREMFYEFIDGSTVGLYNRKLDSKALDIITNDMYVQFNQRLYRQVLVDWLLEAGFGNIKLWGNGWTDNEKYQPYAMGPAENGETLSKIYQASKIVIGNNITTTNAARAWETMLSGGFYLSNYIPEEEDFSDIRKIVEIGKDVIMFYGKEDLIEKTKYYLEHEDERQIMIERGRKVALEKMTFDILMKRTLSEVARRLEE